MYLLLLILFNRPTPWQTRRGTRAQVPTDNQEEVVDIPETGDNDGYVDDNNERNDNFDDDDDDGEYQCMICMDDFSDQKYNLLHHTTIHSVCSSAICTGCVNRIGGIVPTTRQGRPLELRERQACPFCKSRDGWYREAGTVPEEEGHPPVIEQNIPLGIVRRVQKPLLKNIELYHDFIFDEILTHCLNYHIGNDTNGPYNGCDAGRAMSHHEKTMKVLQYQNSKPGSDLEECCRCHNEFFENDMNEQRGENTCDHLLCDLCCKLTLYIPKSERIRGVDMPYYKKEATCPANGCNGEGKYHSIQTNVTCGIIYQLNAEPHEKRQINIALLRQEGHPTSNQRNLLRT